MQQVIKVSHENSNGIIILSQIPSIKVTDIETLMEDAHYLTNYQRDKLLEAIQNFSK